MARIMSGTQPTVSLHPGIHLGALADWLKLRQAHESSGAARARGEAEKTMQLVRARIGLRQPRA